MSRVLCVLQFIHFISFHVCLKLLVVFGLFSLRRLVKVVEWQFQPWLRQFQINLRPFIPLLVLLVDIIGLFQCVLWPGFILRLELLFHLFLHLFEKTHIFTIFRSFDRFRSHFI